MTSPPRDPDRSDPGRTAGVGAYLANQRRLRGISVDELCEITKIPRRNLERLESGAFDETPDGFARGFVRTVAAALGLDPDEAVMRLMQEPEGDADLAAPYGRRELLRVGALLLALALVLGLWKLASEWLARAPEEAEAPELLFRRDAVGDLAREREFAFPAEPAPAPAPAQPPGPAQAPPEIP